jgi:hypothetical protein
MTWLYQRPLKPLNELVPRIPQYKVGSEIWIGICELDSLCGARHVDDSVVRKREKQRFNDKIWVDFEGKRG